MPLEEIISRWRGVSGNHHVDIPDDGVGGLKAIPQEIQVNNSISGFIKGRL